MGVFFGWVFFQPFNKSFSSAAVFFPRVFFLGVFFGTDGLPAEHGCSVILEQPMTSTRRRKCRHCRQLYDPDPRNHWHQRNCSQPACQQASKAASQRRWRASPKGRDYFRGPAILDGERLSYRTLDVEQIGSVYEAIMGFRLEIAGGRSIAIKPVKHHGAPATINLESLLSVKPGDRAKWLLPGTRPRCCS